MHEARPTVSRQISDGCPQPRIFQDFNTGLHLLIANYRRRHNAIDPPHTLSRHRALAHVIGVIAYLAILSRPTPAAAQTWVGGPFNDWNTGSNWSTGVVPNNVFAIANFTGNTPLNPNISASVVTRSLVFSNPTGSYTLTSSAGKSLSALSSITVGAGVTGVETINLANISTGSLLFPDGSDLTITNNSTASGTTLVIGPNTVIGTAGNLAA